MVCGGFILMGLIPKAGGIWGGVWGGAGYEIGGPPSPLTHTDPFFLGGGLPRNDTQEDVFVHQVRPPKPQPTL